jgi:DNA-binding CsgD family transcriptional regulator
MDLPPTGEGGGVELQLVQLSGMPGTAPHPDIHPVQEAEWRVRQLSAAAQAKYGDDPLFAALIDEAECLCLALITPKSLIDGTAVPPWWSDLTPRERQVAGLLADDMTDRQIADALAISLNTARSYSTAVLSKLDLHARRRVRHLVSPVTSTPFRAG